MLTELRKKAQITIPREFVKKLGLKEGDKLEVVERDGVIYLMPVAVYPKKYIDELRDEITAVKTKLYSGEQLVFERVDDLFTQLEKKER